MGIFRALPNQIKSVINKSKRIFVTIIMLFQQATKGWVWRVVHRILQPSPKPLQEDQAKTLF